MAVRGQAAVLAIAGTAALCLVVAPAASAAVCPTTVDASAFASKAKLRALVTKEMGFGHRNLASASHKKLIDWVENQVQRIDGAFKLRSDPFRVWRWLPRTPARDRPGLDIERAGGLTVSRPRGTSQTIRVAGAVHWSKPTGRKGRGGRLVYLAPDQEITAENAAGRVVIRDFPDGSLPYAAFPVVGLYLTPDLASETGNYERPFINELHQELLAAGRAGAAGVVFAFDVPREQVRGYYDPHQGTLYRLPAVFVGDAEGTQLKALATQGRTARVAVRAKVDRGRTRNLIATLPGRSRERIVLSTNTDGNSWVQENGVAGILALARYYAQLPTRCRPRTLVLAFGSAHDALVREGTESTQPDWTGSTTRARLRSRSRSSTSARERYCRRRIPTAPGNVSGSPAGASRFYSPRATAMSCARPRSRRRSAAGSTGPRSCAASGPRPRASCRRSARWAVSATPSTGT
jgi:hypothetical protein